MLVKTLDPKKTHTNNPNCPSRLAQDPRGNWYCIDCGFRIVWTEVCGVEAEDRIFPERPSG